MIKRIPIRVKLAGALAVPLLLVVSVAWMPGAETGSENLVGTAVVASPYGAEGQALATLGTLGPTRMDYPGSMAAVRAVARYVSRILDEGNQ